MVNGWYNIILCGGGGGGGGVGAPCGGGGGGGGGYASLLGGGALLLAFSWLCRWRKCLNIASLLEKLWSHSGQPVLSILTCWQPKSKWSYVGSVSCFKARYVLSDYQPIRIQYHTRHAQWLYKYLYMRMTTPILSFNFRSARSKDEFVFQCESFRTENW